MNTPLDTLLAGERAKIELLRAKIRECEQRISTLLAMQSDDDLDAVLSRRVQAADAVVPAAVPASGLVVNGVAIATQARSEVKAEAFPKRVLNETTRKLLRFAAGPEKSIGEFLVFAQQNGIARDRQGMRAFLHQYKATYGLLNSDRPGHFRLSETGASYLRSIDPLQGAPNSAT
jgi:hypothetical protein